MKFVALDEVARIDRTVASSEEYETLPYVGLEHIEKDAGRFAAEFDGKPESLRATKFRFTSKHVLYGKLRPYLNKVALPAFDGVCTTEILPILPAEDKLDRTYLWAFLLTPGFVEWASSNVSGANLPRISPKLLAKYRIPLPPLPEQKRIAAILAKADRLRRLRRTARDLSDTYLQSVFLEMFGGPVSNPMGWESVDFGEVISIISGHGFKRAEYSDSGVRLLQIANVSFQEIIWGTLAYLPSDYIERYPKLVLRPGDLLMALNRPILGHRVKFAILKEEDCPAILYQRVGKFVIEAENLNRDYLYGFMLTDYYFRQLEIRLAGSDQPYINPTELVKMRFLLPPLSLQQQFAHIVYRFERLRARQREAERQAEHLFQTLLHRAFRGEL